MLRNVLAPGLVLLLTLAGGCGQVPPALQPVARGDEAAVIRQLQARIDHGLRAQRLAGVSIALVDDQRVVWAHGAGLADAATGQPATPQTVYRMGSISKLLTDTAALQLVSAGRLALDAPLQQALPGWQTDARWPDRPVTLRQLMTHHAGLPRDKLGGMWGHAVEDFRGVAAWLASDQAIAPPGRAFSYSNLGLDLVGLAIEQASGRRFEDQLRVAVLEPLGMASASFSTGPAPGPGMARGHLNGEPRDEPDLRDVPAGGLNASVLDLARFVSLQFAEGRNAQGVQVLAPPALAEMLRVQNADVPLDAGFEIGLGWLFSTFGADTVHGGGPVAHHAGATFHHRSMVMMLPAQRLGVVVASNDAAGGPFVNALAQQALALLLEARTGQRQPPREPGFVPARQPWSPEQRQACVGEWAVLGDRLTVTADGDHRLTARLGDRSLDLLDGEDGALGVRVRLGGLIPVSLGALAQVGVQCRRIDGHDLLVARLDGQQLVLGERLPPIGPLPAPELAARVGRYRPVLAEGEVSSLDDAALELLDGRLWLTVRLVAALGGQRVRFPLAPDAASGQARVLAPWADGGARVDLLPEVRASGWRFEPLAR